MNNGPKAAGPTLLGYVFEITLLVIFLVLSSLSLIQFSPVYSVTSSSEMNK